MYPNNKILLRNPQSPLVNFGPKTFRYQNSTVRSIMFSRVVRKVSYIHSKRLMRLCDKPGKEENIKLK
jgi:hypothetical protein